MRVLRVVVEAAAANAANAARGGGGGQSCGRRGLVETDAAVRGRVVASSSTARGEESEKGFSCSRCCLSGEQSD